jgi:hypothetical protein
MSQHDNEQIDAEVNGLYKPYKAKNGRTQFKPSLEYLKELDEGNEGFCLNCAGTQSAEPDAAKYVCESCDQPKVYGTAELALMGLVY